MNKNNTVNLDIEENYNLLEFLRENSPYAPDEEQHDFESFDIYKLLDGEFEDLVIEELIQYEYLYLMTI